MLRRTSFISIVIGLAITSPAAAQYTPLMNPLIRTTIPQIIQCPGCNKAQKQKRDDVAVRAAPPSAVATLRFTPASALRKAALTQFAATTGSSSVDTPLGSFLLTGNPVAGIDQQMVSLGLSPTNLGDVTAMFIINQWLFAREITTPPARATTQSVRAQMQRVLLSEPRLGQMTNAAKQREADPMMILMAVMTKVGEGAASSPSATKSLAAAATKTLIGMGLDPAEVELTAQGMQAVTP